jgi:hypothetical protein
MGSDVAVNRFWADRPPFVTSPANKAWLLDEMRVRIEPIFTGGAPVADLAALGHGCRKSTPRGLLSGRGALSRGGSSLVDQYVAAHIRTRGDYRSILVRPDPR